MRYLFSFICFLAFACAFSLQAQEVQSWDSYHYSIGSEGQIEDGNEENSPQRLEKEWDESQKKLQEEMGQHPDGKEKEFGEFPQDKLDPDNPLEEAPLQEGEVD